MKLLLSALCLFAMADTGFSANRLCYGDVMSLHPKGQYRNETDSWSIDDSINETDTWSIDDSINETDTWSIDDSINDVWEALYDLENDYNCYQEAADKFCIQASVIAAIVSRESRDRRLCKAGNAPWTIQCDIRYEGLDCQRCNGHTCCQIEMIAGFLVNLIRKVAKKTNWSPERSLQGGVAAYNYGVDNVWSWDNLDKGTTHEDYSNDVIARAQKLLNLKWN